MKIFKIIYDHIGVNVIIYVMKTRREIGNLDLFISRYRVTDVIDRLRAVM